MFSPNWRRPESVSIPQVWRRFEKTTKDGKNLKFKIQDATEDLYDDIVSLMVDYFLRDEPWMTAAGVSGDPPSLEIFKGYVTEYVFPQKATLVCVLDEDDEPNKGDKQKLVGCNLTGICLQNDDEFDESITSASFDKLQSIFVEMKKNCPDVYDKYKVECYMSAFGLCVHPAYRGLYISAELLSARAPLCKAIGIKLTSTIFTATASQKAATKVNFVEDASVSYEHLSKITGLSFPNCVNCKLMSLKID